jgi:HEAT repeat protein
MLNETRAENVLIRIGEDLAGEEEQTRSMAVEALGNTANRLATQLALQRRLFDSSVGVCYSALCALSFLSFSSPGTLPLFLKRALSAKLQDAARLTIAASLQNWRLRFWSGPVNPRRNLPRN